MPGEYISFSDFPEGQEDIVAIHCLDDDSGGEVYRFREDEDFRMVGERRNLLADISVEENAVDTVGYNDTSEQVFIGSDGTEATLFLRHMARFLVNLN